MVNPAECVAAIEKLIKERNACMSPEQCKVAQYYSSLEDSPPVVQLLVKSWGEYVDPKAPIVCMGESDSGAESKNAPPGVLEFVQAANQCEANCILADAALRSLAPDVKTMVWGCFLDTTLNPLVYNCFKHGIEPLLSYASQDPMPCKSPFGGHAILVALFPEDGSVYSFDPSVRQLAHTFEEALGPMVKVERLSQMPRGFLRPPCAKDMAEIMTQEMKLEPEKVSRMKELYRRLGWDPSLVLPLRDSPTLIRKVALSTRNKVARLMKC